MRLTQNTLAMTAGMTAIVAQLVWVRYETQLLGLSSWTIAAVIGMSLLGLAIGNLWGGMKPRFESSLKFASVLLCLTGLTVFLLPVMFWGIASIETTLFQSTSTGGGEKLWILAVAAPALLVHFFAGAVFPALLHGRDSTASTAGRLAAVETVGGCVGATLTGCLLMQLWGMQLTVLICGAGAMLVGALGLRAAKGVVDYDNAPRAESKNTAGVKFSPHIYAAVFLAGIASLGLEVVWQRSLIFLVGTDAYSLTIVVVAYLIGIALGAALAARWLKRDMASTGNVWRTRVAVLQLAGALVSVIVLAVLVYLASGPGLAWLNTSFGLLETPLLKRAALCCGLLVFPAAVYGASWPLLLRALVSDRGDNVGESELAALAAKVYAVVAFGNVTGVVLTGFYLVPALGLQVSLLVLVAITAVAVWMIIGANFNRMALILTGLLVCFGVAKWIWMQPIGVVTQSDDELLYYREGPAHTVSVLAEPDRPKHRRLSVDGIVVGQSGDNVEEKQLVLAHLAPMLSAGRKPVKNAVVIGLGSGILSRELAGIEGVGSVTSVELSPSVIEAAEEFADLSKPTTAKTNTVQADGVWWLKKQTQKFDAIISDGKSRPGHVGNSAFFSVDYYRSAASRLADEGLFIQWVSLDADVRETRIVIRTFAESFSHAYVAIATPNSLYLVRSNVPVKCDRAAIEQYLDSPAAKSLNTYFWRNADDIRAMGWIKMPPLWEGSEVGGVKDFLVQAEANSLDRPLLERVSFDVRTEKLKANRIENLDMLELLLGQADEMGIFDDSAQQQADLKKAIVELLGMARHEVQQEQGWVNKAVTRYREALNVMPDLSRGQRLAKMSFVAAAQAAERIQPDREANLLIQGASISRSNFDTQMRVAKRLDELSRFEDSIGIYSEAVQLVPNDVAANRGLANALLKSGKQKQAARYFRAAGDEARAAEIEKRFGSSSSTGESGVPTIPQPETDEERTKRLLEILGE